VPRTYLTTVKCEVKDFYKMKIKINLKIGKEEDMTFPIRVSESDSACSVKERVALMQPIPFPDQDLMLGGRVLTD